jgi:transcriptional regulator with XRE-family HTH domain
MGQITLQAARTSFGYSQEEVAHYCGISTATYIKFEKDTRLLPIKTIRMIRTLLNLPLALMYIGPESEYIKRSGKSKNK